MRILLLYVHPRPDSFCSRVREEAQAALLDQGHEVELADLYAENFNPAMTAQDFVQFEGGTMGADILSEQARVDRNEAMIVVSPIWWWQFPAMLKGWIDRVFIEGWAFSNSQSANIKPILNLKRVLVLGTAGAPLTRFEKHGYLKGIRTLWDEGVWGYCGVRCETRILWEVDPFQMSPEQARSRLDEAGAMVRGFGRTLP